MRITIPPISPQALDRLRAALALPLRECAWRHGAEVATDAALVLAASMGAPLPDGWQAAIAHAAAQRFPVTAADLMPQVQGAELGSRLKAMEARWIASGFTLSRAALLAG